ncbi:MAG: restriction endonuclease subunit S [Simplicispira sp.]|nr:restriction endonuclease subunit S [Simplicispira sp.]
MSFAKYPAYKDSGVEWLGEVPAHWHVKRLRHVAMLNPSKSEVAHFPRDAEVSFLPMEAVGEDGTLNLDRTRPIGEVESGYTYFREGDVTVAKITPCFENGKGAVMRGLHNGHGFGTTELIVARPSEGSATSDYLHLLFTSHPFRLLGEASMYGAGGQKRVPDDFVRNFAVAFPPLSEQTAIATFLDRETTKIDALVAEQEKLIALLQEKRQAVISHAVTKGLNPNAPMKDSGVEWLGEVPAHWEVRRVKHLVTTLEQGWSPQCEGFPVQSDEEWGVLKVGCVNGGVFRPEENKTLPLELEPVPELGVAAGDLLISRANTRELVGGAAVALLDYPRLMLCDKLYRIRFRPETCEPVFLALYLSTPRIRGQIELAATGASSSMLNIGQSTILELDVAVPPLDEQRQILNVVSDQIDNANALVVQARTAITLLQERRTALISAAVTGQIDVRGWAGSLNTPVLIASSAYTASA